jgi:hypothetical protein
VHCSGGFIDDDCHGQFVKDGGVMALYGLKMDDFLLSVMVRHPQSIVLMKPNIDL